MNNLSIIAMIFLCPLTALYSQDSSERLIITESEWVTQLNKLPMLKAKMLSTAIELNKIIEISDIINYPSPEYLIEGVLGTLQIESNKIIIYLDKSSISNDHLFAIVLTHEYIHFIMDNEGYPITHRTSKYSQDPAIAQIGTSIQDVVLHYELFRRQCDYGINTKKFPIPVEPFISYLKNSSIKIDAMVEKKIRVILSIKTELSKEEAFEKIGMLIELLNLTDKLYVAITNN